MSGIPGLLYKDLRAILLECGPFGSQDRDRLVALFDDHQLRPWRHTIPEGNNKLLRVEALITFLYNKPFDKPNPLLRFMRVLTERTLEPGCHQQLQRLSGLLAQHFGEPQITLAGPQADSTVDPEKISARKALLNALMDAFPSVRELERMVALEMDLNLHAIARNGNLPEVTFDLIRWLDSREQLPQLIRAARRQNMSNRALAEVAKRFGID